MNFKAYLTQRKRGAEIAVGLLFLFASAYVHQEPSRCPTPRSRLDLLHAIVVRRTLNIDDYHENTQDKASYGGHYFSDKAPGTVVLALPAFAASAITLKVLCIKLDSDQGWLYSSWIASVGSIGVVSALGACLLFSWLSMYVSPKHALVTVLGLFLGAAPLPYATMMFSHALVIGLLAIAIWSIDALPGVEVAACGIRLNCSDVLAGFTCGWALASEYTAGIVVVGIFFWLISRARNRAIPFCLAALPPLLLIPLYNYACFGNPFILPYSLNESFPAMKRGLYAIKWPNAETAFLLLFSPERGLLFWTPFLMMAVVGWWQLAQRDRKLFWLTYAIPLLQVVVISGRTWDWPAGPTLGPRYLAPILPLLALPCALGVQRLRTVAWALALYSVGVTTLATLTDACPDFDTHPNPLFDLNMPLFLAGKCSPNIGMLVGLPPAASVVLYYGILVGSIWLLSRTMAAGRPYGQLKEPAPAA